MAPCRSLEGKPTQHSLEDPDGQKDPEQAENPAWLQLCTLGGGYRVNGTCQMRRVLSVSPHGAGLPLLPEALPKLR